jgi:hypothetical protein
VELHKLKVVFLLREGIHENWEQRLGTMMERVKMPWKPQGAHERKRKMEIIGFAQGDEGIGDKSFGALVTS